MRRLGSNGRVLPHNRTLDVWTLGYSFVSGVVVPTPQPSRVLPFTSTFTGPAAV